MTHFETVSLPNRTVGNRRQAQQAKVGHVTGYENSTPVKRGRHLARRSRDLTNDTVSSVHWERSSVVVTHTNPHGLSLGEDKSLRLGRLEAIRDHLSTADSE